MKVDIEHAPFHELIGRAAKALAVRPTAPALAGLLLQAEEGVLRASAFDFELAVRASAPAAVGEPGSVRLTYPEKVRPVVMTGTTGTGAEADERFRYLFIPLRPSSASGPSSASSPKPATA